MHRRVLLVLLICLLAALAPPEAAGARGPSAVEVIETTANLHDALTRLPDLHFRRGRRGPGTAIEIDDAEPRQQIGGFGAAMTDTSAWLLQDQLSAAQRSLALRELFGAGGIGLALLRIPIGASDFTAGGTPYTYDDDPPGGTDPALAHFSIAHDAAYILPLLRQVLAVQPHLFTLASTWSAPAWMKANDALNNIGGAGTLLPADYVMYADYVVRFLQAYAGAGVPVDGITLQNEPRSDSPYPGMAFSPDDEAYWLVEDLAPALAGAGLHPLVFGLDDTPLADARTILATSASRLLAGIAFHCYHGLGPMGALHAEQPGVLEMVSECSPGMIPYPVSEVAIDAVDNGASTVAYWNLALNRTGGPVEEPNRGCPRCTGLITVSEATHSVRFGANFYDLGQVARYVRPGAVRLEAQRPVHDLGGLGPYEISRGVDDAAFRNADGSRVLVAYDNARRAALISVGWRGSWVSLRLPAHATVTLRWNALPAVSRDDEGRSAGRGRR